MENSHKQKTETQTKIKFERRQTNKQTDRSTTKMIIISREREQVGVGVERKSESLILKIVLWMRSIESRSYEKRRDESEGTRRIRGNETNQRERDVEEWKWRIQIDSLSLNPVASAWRVSEASGLVGGHFVHLLFL